MAKMIPATLNDSVFVPNSERRLFEKLKEGPATRDWWVLHSVTVPGLSKNSNPREVDFLILVPNYGVICLEVKGESFDVIDGEWYREHGDGTPVEPPPKQAQAAMDALHSFLKSKVATSPDRSLMGKIYQLPKWYALAFTDHELPANVTVPDCPTYGPDVCLDSTKLCNQLQEFAEKLPKRGKKKVALDAETMRFIVDTVRPDFGMRAFVACAPDLADINRKLKELTQEQYDVLESVLNRDGSMRNDRVLLEGAAGTGKTMLALELARRRLEAGDRVGFICFNEMLNEWARKQIDVSKGAAGVSFLANLDHSHERNWDDDFEICMECLENMEKEGGKWDYLIVDEFQHCIEEEQFLTLDATLNGGLKNGRWALFGDFTFQNYRLARRRYLAERGGTPPSEEGMIGAKERLLLLCPGESGGKGWFEPKPLIVNCRNTLPIARAAGRAVRHPGSSIWTANVAGPEVDFHYMPVTDTNVALFDLIRDVITDLQEHGIKSSEVVVLATGPTLVEAMHEELHIKGRFGSWQLFLAREKGRPFTDNYDGFVGVYDLGDYIGMESDVVVLVQPLVDQNISTKISEDLLASSMYIGMTRARTKLVVIAPEELQNTLQPNDAHVLE